MPAGIDVVTEFIAAINAHDVGAIVALCSEDHQFIDAHGNTVPRADLAAGWQFHFAFMPIYGIDIDYMMGQDNTVAVFGWAWGGLASAAPGAARWRRPAAWRAGVGNGKICRWQVFVDTKIVFDLAGQRD